MNINKVSNSGSINSKNSYNKNVSKRVAFKSSYEILTPEMFKNTLIDTAIAKLKDTFIKSALDHGNEIFVSKKSQTFEELGERIYNFVKNENGFNVKKDVFQYKVSGEINPNKEFNKYKKVILSVQDSDDDKVAKALYSMKMGYIRENLNADNKAAYCLINAKDNKIQPHTFDYEPFNYYFNSANDSHKVFKTTAIKNFKDGLWIGEKEFQIPQTSIGEFKKYLDSNNIKYSISDKPKY